MGLPSRGPIYALGIEGHHVAVPQPFGGLASGSERRATAVQSVLYVTQGIKGIASIMALTGATIIVNVLGNQCPGQLGSVVGASQTLLNLVRAAGPALGDGGTRVIV